MLQSLTILGFVSSTLSLAFPAPQATNAGDGLAREAIVQSPKPTHDPLALFKRDVAGPRTCGWYEDDFGTSTITCPTGTCMAYAPSGLPGGVGCCASFNGGMNYQECGWVNKCYDYSDIVSGLCDDDCQANSFNRVCTVSSLPYCQSFTYPGANVKDYGCDFSSESTWTTVSTDIADFVDGTATAQFAFVPAATTVTGWDGSETSSGSLSSTDRSSSTDTSGPTSSSLPSVGGSARTASIAAIVIILVIIVGSYCIGGCIVAWFCVRSKRNVAKWKSGSSVALIQQPGAPPTPSNVVSPQSGQFGGSYFEPVPQGGAAAGYHNADEHKTPAFMSSQAPMVSPNAPASPAPLYTQPSSPQVPFDYASSQSYAAQHPNTQAYSVYQQNAVEAPAAPAPRPGHVELG